MFEAQQAAQAAFATPVRRQAIVAATGLTGAMLLFLLAGAPVDPVFACSALLEFAAIAALVVWRLGISHPHPTFGMANHATLGRIALNVLLVALVLDSAHSGIGTGGWLLTGIAGLSLALDGVDGWCARRQGTVSAFGARFDMEADALFLSALSAAAFLFDRAGPWVFAIAAAYYAFIGARRVAPWLGTPLPPLPRRKVVFVAVAAALLVATAPVGVAFPAGRLLGAAGVLLAASFATDIVWLWRNRARGGLARPVAFGNTDS